MLNEKPGDSYGKLSKSSNIGTKIGMDALREILGLFLKGGEDSVEINTLIRALS